jgi:hypothetical protein
MVPVPIYRYCLGENIFLILSSEDAKTWVETGLMPTNPPNTRVEASVVLTSTDLAEEAADTGTGTEDVVEDAEDAKTACESLINKHQANKKRTGISSDVEQLEKAPR